MREEGSSMAVEVREEGEFNDGGGEGGGGVQWRWR